MPRVLIVDDQSGIAYANAALVSSFDCDVRIATDGAMALALVTDWKPDIVLLDLVMPGMNGDEVAERLPAGTKIVVVSSSRPTSGKFDHYLPKPLDKVSIGEVIRQLTAEEFEGRRLPR